MSSTSTIAIIGKYWCQVINTTADPDQPLMRSNVFTLLAPEDYSQLTCSAVVQSEFNSTCADLPVQITLLTSLTTTTLSSYMSIHCSKIPDCTTISAGCRSMFALFYSVLLLFYRSYYCHENSCRHHLIIIRYTILSPASPTANVLPIVYSVSSCYSVLSLLLSV